MAPARSWHFHSFLISLGVSLIKPGPIKLLALSHCAQVCVRGNLHLAGSRDSPRRRQVQGQETCLYAAVVESGFALQSFQRRVGPSHDTLRIHHVTICRLYGHHHVVTQQPSGHVVEAAPVQRKCTFSSATQHFLTEKNVSDKDEDLSTRKRWLDPKWWWLILSGLLNYFSRSATNDSVIFSDSDKNKLSLYKIFFFFQGVFFRVVFLDDAQGSQTEQTCFT